MRPLLAVLAVLIAAAPAGAATVRVDELTRVAAFVAASGERNDLTVTGGRDAVTFRDAGAVIRAGRGCRRLGAHAAVCAHGPGLSAVESRLGDRADAYAVRGRRRTALQAWGGRGPDRLVGGSFKDVLDGDRGADRLLGRGGPDLLVGGRGDDLVSAGSGFRDRMLPGPGDDTIRCGTRTPDPLTESDWVIGPEPGELLTDDCELATFPVTRTLYVQITPTPIPSGSSDPAFELRCPTSDRDYEDTPWCGGTLELTHDGRVIGNASFPADDYSHSIRPEYTAEGRRLAGRPGGARATADLVVGAYSVSWTLRLEI
jgi:hypothetical protein